MLKIRGSVKFLLIGAVAVIGWGICFWGFEIPAEKQKAAQAERQASGEKQKQLVAQATGEEQKRQEVAGPQNRVVPDQYATIQAAIDAAKSRGHSLGQSGCVPRGFEVQGGN